LRRGEDGPAIELADERLLDDMMEQVIEHSNYGGVIKNSFDSGQQ
jgi:hypothetical protein